MFVCLQPKRKVVKMSHTAVCLPSFPNLEPAPAQLMSNGHCETLTVGEKAAGFGKCKYALYEPKYKFTVYL